MPQHPLQCSHQKYVDCSCSFAKDFLTALYKVEDSVKVQMLQMEAKSGTPPPARNV